ncbi:MarR family transcriptional regulator [Streptomyces sp. NPDC006422]|uniref:MarR family winged helix-turn-helix transcriptional regulator n=1 Tax=unclassified Streptomyces TaxID=2593676 RepID=UPI0033A88693
MSEPGAGQQDAVAAMLEQWQREFPEVDATALGVFGRLHRSFNRYQAQLNAFFDTYDLTVPAFGVLAALRRAGAPYRRTVSELADANLLTSGGITQRVDKLEAAGLALRVRDPDDRRIVHIQLTDRGLALAEEIIGAHFAHEADMLADLTEPERDQLAGLLSRLERSLDRAAERTSGRGSGEVGG